MVRDLRRARGEIEGFPEVLFVFQGTPAEGVAFFERFWPEARAVADPVRELNAAFELKRGGLGQFLAPGVAVAGLRALVRGNGIGRPVGDVRAMPGLFLIANERVLWSQEFGHIGQRLDLRGVVELIDDRA